MEVRYLSEPPEIGKLKLFHRHEGGGSGSGYHKKEHKGHGFGLKKVALTVPRNSFLLLVRANVHHLASNLKKAEEKSPGTLKKFWERFGGKDSKLMDAIRAGADKKGIFGPEAQYIGIAGELAVALASAAAIILPATKLLKSLGIGKKGQKNDDGTVTTDDDDTEAQMQQALLNEPEEGHLKKGFKVIDADPGTENAASGGGLMDSKTFGIPNIILFPAAAAVIYTVVKK